jgi:hypothetical protein
MHRPSSPSRCVWPVGVVAFFLGVALPAKAAPTGEISGWIHDTSGNNVANAEVRLYRVDGASPAPGETKGQYITKYYPTASAGTLFHGPDGTYSFRFPGLPAGTYKIMARVIGDTQPTWNFDHNIVTPTAFPGYHHKVTDRWFANCGATGNPCTPSDVKGLSPSTAEPIVLLNDAAQYNNADIYLRGDAGAANSGVEGVVGWGYVTLQGASPSNPVFIRIERGETGRWDEHHVILTNADTGHYYCAGGLAPSPSYEIIAVDPFGNNITRVITGVSLNDTNASPQNPATTQISTITMAAQLNDDPTNDQTYATGRDVTLAINDLRTTGNVKLFPSDTTYGVITQGDVDFYCFAATATDNFTLRVRSPLGAALPGRYNPFVDPMVAWWGPGGKLKQNDDDGDEIRAAKLETGETGVAGKYCVAVTMYPDTGFSGAHDPMCKNHASWGNEQCGALGTYQLLVGVGNRRPTLAVYVTYDGDPMTTIGLSDNDNLKVLVGQSAMFTLVPVDPDQDPISYAIKHIDRDEKPVEAEYGTDENGYPTYTWVPLPGANLGNNYQITFRVWDSTYKNVPTTMSVNVAVSGQTEAPPAPVLATGVYGASCGGLEWTASQPTAFIIGHVEDPQHWPVTLELRAYDMEEDPATRKPVYDVVVQQDEEAASTWIPFDRGIFKEDRRYGVQVKADDGANPSFWSQPLCDFFVNLENQPPGEVLILEPRDGSTLPTNTTSYNVHLSNTTDPDVFQTLQIAYCISFDESFADCPMEVTDWPRVPQSSMDPSEETLIPVEGLKPGAHLAVEAAAIDPDEAYGPIATSLAVVASAAAAPLKAGVPAKVCSCAGPELTLGSGLAWLVGTLGLAVARRRKRS